MHIAIFLLCAIGGTGFLENGVTAHRGLSSDYPENTQAAIKAAIEVGCDWIEVDIHRTKDGRIVVIHNGDTGKYVSQKLVVAETDLEVLKRLDFAERFREGRGLSMETCPVQRILTLEEAVDIIRTQVGTRIHFELKERLGKEAAEIITKMNAARWCGFNCDYIDWLADAKAVNPDITLIWDRQEIAPEEFDDDVAKAKALGVYAMVLRGDTVTQARVDRLLEAGIQPGVWTINAREQMDALLRMGVYRIYTDRPGVLFEAKAALKRQGPGE